MLAVTHAFAYMENPLIMSAFLLERFDQACLEVRICALSGLLHLFTAHNLDFSEDYFERLYTLISTESFEIRFQRILNASLVHAEGLPGLDAACYAKRLIRLAMEVRDVQAICWCLAMAFNVIKKNP